MIAFITLIYCGFLWLIFFKFELLPWNRNSQLASAGIGIAAILAIVFSMNIFQSYSQDVRVYMRIVQITPRVTGRVIEVPIRANVPVRAGAVLFRIDPKPIQYTVDRLTADLKLKKTVLDDAKVLAGAGAAAEIKRDRAQSAFDQTLALLRDAQIDLDETTVYAPTDGVVTNLGLRPGQTATQMASMPVMTFIETDRRILVATFSQAALKFVHVDDTAEIAFNRLPGEIVSARVQSLIPGTGQGQLPPSGTLMEFTTNPVPGRFAVLLEVDDSESLSLPAGASGVAAIYTSHAQKIQIIRKVVIRMTSWLNYIIR